MADVATRVEGRRRGWYLFGLDLSIVAAIFAKNVAHAEIPGSPSTRSRTWIVLVVFAVLFGVLDALLIRSFLRLRRHQRDMQTRAATL